MKENERLRAAREHLNLTMKQLSDIIDVPERTISNYELGERKVSVEYIQKLYTHLSISPIWLLTEKGDIKTKGGSQNNYTLIPYDPILMPNTSGTEPHVIFHNDWLKDFGENKNLRLIHMPSDNMEPTIFKGNTLMVDYSITSFDSNGIYLIELYDKHEIKRIQPTNIGFQLINDNSHYPIITLSSEALNIMGKVVWTENIL